MRIYIFILMITLIIIGDAIQNSMYLYMYIYTLHVWRLRRVFSERLWGPCTYTYRNHLILIFNCNWCNWWIGDPATLRSVYALVNQSTHLPLKLQARYICYRNAVSTVVRAIRATRAIRAMNKHFCQLSNLQICCVLYMLFVCVI